ncbi:uncharacterized protein pmfbp1 isoform X2 [Brachyhypopomus gauderio]|uniref:uncharacterized protein pmfbp1 isoform X2 n=1 Tax=Brachyhypopomus gauderio TaxID=698409 RepID=UPI00404162EC
MVCTTQTSQAEVHTLEQRTAGLEEQLETARRQCTQKEKAVQKRDTLLRQSEADLVRARDELRARAAEAERQGGVVRALEAELRRARKEKRRLEAEGAALSAHLLQVQRELTESHATCRERALELARQQERVEQLEACAAEVVHSEQDQRRLQEELEKLQHRLHSTTQDLHDCRVLLEQARGEATGSRQAQLGVQEEAATLLQETRLLREELGASKQTIGRLQEQLKDQVDAAQALSTVLSQQEVRHQETLHREQSARNRENSLQTERDQLRTDLESAKNQARVSEGRLVELGAQLTHTRLWGQQQLDSLQSTEEEMVLLKVELASVTEGYHSAVAQVEVLRAQMDLAERRMEAAATEVEELREALDEARRDTSRLHHESELVVTNVNQWVKEQKETHEKFGLRIKDQSKRIVHLTAENDHLQERVEALQAQVRRLQAEVDGRRLEVESRENVGAGNAGDSRSVSAQPHQRLAATPHGLTSTATYSHQREHPHRAGAGVSLGPS